MYWNNLKNVVEFGMFLELVEDNWNSFLSLRPQNTLEIENSQVKERNWTFMRKSTGWI